MCSNKEREENVEERASQETLFINFICFGVHCARNQFSILNIQL